MRRDFSVLVSPWARTDRHTAALAGMGGTVSGSPKLMCSHRRALASSARMPVARIDDIGGWQVTVSVMEFLREDPLETEFRRRMAAALRAVGGVATADEQDREIWFVTGTPSGKAPAQAAAQGIDEMADEARARMHHF